MSDKSFSKVFEWQVGKAGWWSKHFRDEGEPSLQHSHLYRVLSVWVGLLLWLCDQVQWNPRMLWGKSYALTLLQPYFLVFGMGLLLVWENVDENIHLSEKMLDSDVDYSADC